MNLKGRDQTKAGAGLSYLLMFVSILSNFLVVGYMISALGDGEYGVYSTVVLWAGYMAVMDFGIGVAIVRYVAKYRVKGDTRGQQNFLATSLVLYTAIALIVLAVGLLLSNQIGSLIFRKLKVDQIDTAKTMFIILVVNMVLSIPFGAFRAVMDGYEQFVLPRVLNIVRSILRVVLVSILLQAGYHAIAVVIVDTVLNIFMQILIMLYVLLKLKVRFRFSKFDWTFVREIFVFSLFIFLTMVYDKIFWGVDQAIINEIYGEVMAAVCNLGVMITMSYMRFSTAISEVFLPRVTKMVVDGANNQELTDFMIKVGRVQMLVLGLVLTGFALFGQAFMQVWGNQTDNKAYLISMIVMVPLTIPLIQNTGISILQAKNMHRFRSTIYFIIALLNVVATIYLVKNYGILGAPAATAIALVIGNVIIINIYYKKKIGLEIGRFFKESLLFLLPGLLLPLLGGYFLANRFLQATLPSILLWGIVYTVIYFAVNWLITMNSFEKGLFKSVLKRIGIIRSRNA